MNALSWITREAKRLRRKYPRRYATWKEYVGQASAIYARKYKGKSPVGKPRKKGKVPKVAKPAKTGRVVMVKTVSSAKIKHTVLHHGSIVNLRSIRHPGAGSFLDGLVTIRKIDKKKNVVATTGNASSGRRKRLLLSIPFSYLRSRGYLIN